MLLSRLWLNFTCLATHLFTNHPVATIVTLLVVLWLLPLVAIVILALIVFILSPLWTCKRKRTNGTIH